MSTLRSKEKGAPQFWEACVFTLGLQGEGERDLPCRHHPPLHGKGKWIPCLSFNASSFLFTHIRKTLNWVWQLSLVFWVLGLPRRVSGKESTCQHRRCRFDPWVGKIPHEGKGYQLAWKIPWTKKPARLQSMGSRSQKQLSHWACMHTSGYQRRQPVQLWVCFLLEVKKLYNST